MTKNRATNQINNRWESFIVIFVFCYIAFLTLFPEAALAGTGGEAELKVVYEKTEQIISGYGAKLVALLAFGTGAIGAIKGNPWVFIPGFGTALIAGIGPKIFTSGIAALI